MRKTGQIITIDGPAASGKSTASRLLAKKLNFLWVNTGYFYRALAFAKDQLGMEIKKETDVAELLSAIRLSTRKDKNRVTLLLDGRDIGNILQLPRYSAEASRLSAIPRVRRFLFPLQRQTACLGNIIAEGRDAGTHIFPEASVKVFLDASLETRARRRFKQLMGKESYQTLLQSMEERDERDRRRHVAPLQPADDAHYLNTDRLSVDDVVEAILAIVNRTLHLAHP